MIAALVVILVACGALIWVLGPLRRNLRAIAIDETDRPQADLQRGTRSDAVARRKDALAAIVDLEGEHDVGKLSRPDFLALRAEYEAEAVAALRELDALGDSRDDDLEAEIAAMRERLTCPSCGAERRPGRPCERCGG